MNWLNMTLMMLGLTLWIVVLVVLVWAIMRWLNNRTTRSRQAQALPESGLTALEILNQRYARGEIDATTFEQMRERLTASDNIHQKIWAEGHRPTGEKLFDGNTRGAEIL